MRNMRHVVTVMRPTEASDDGGQTLTEAVWRPDVPCSIEHLSGREAEKAKALYAEATEKVQLYGNPLKPLKRTHWLELPGPHGVRKLHIGDIDGDQMTGGLLTLLCGEEPK